MTPIFSISPVNKIKVIVGYYDLISREAVFHITPKRLFQQAEGGTGAIGIDERIMRRKFMNWCDKIVFKMWDGKVYRIKKSDFLENCWIYPQKADKEYKAAPGIFQPKLMLSLEKTKKLATDEKKDEDLEMLKLSVQ